MNPTLQRLHKLTVVIGIPSTGDWKEKFGVSMINLVNAFHRYRVGNYKAQTLRIVSTKGSILPNLRLHCLKMAKQHNADYLLFVDSDEWFPSWTIHQLISRDVDVVGANIPTKTIPTMPTARRYSPDKLEGELVYTDPEMKHMEEVWQIGTGCLMLSKKAIHALPHSCFAMPFVEVADKFQGEDWSMTNALKERGFKIYIDHALSQQIGHFGDFKYTHELNGHVERIQSYGLESEGQESDGVDEVGRHGGYGVSAEDVY